MARYGGGEGTTVGWGGRSREWVGAEGKDEGGEGEMKGRGKGRGRKGSTVGWGGGREGVELGGGRGGVWRCQEVKDGEGKGLTGGG